MSKEQLPLSASINTSPEVAKLLLPEQSLAPDMPEDLSLLLEHLTVNMQKRLEVFRQSGKKVFFAGPDWARANAETAGKDHSKVILEAYGNTYALPNKDPKANESALNSGNLDMYLMYIDNEAAGTACLVSEGDGIAELGRAASVGNVGNSIIQDMRIMRWLTDPEISKKYHTIFATCRTAPDRNIGTEEEPEIMRGGQAVSHMWQRMPSVKVAGFGPFYKKHGALEQFAYAFISKNGINPEDELWIQNPTNADFVKSWLVGNGILRDPKIENKSVQEIKYSAFHASFPPHESGITDLVHGEIEFQEEGLELKDAIDQLAEAGVPFMQIKVPVDHDTLAIQRELEGLGFQAFLFTPKSNGKDSSALWFGKINGDIPVIPTYWSDEILSNNPFWKGNLAMHSNRIARGWSRLNAGK